MEEKTRKDSGGRGEEGENDVKRIRFKKSIRAGPRSTELSPVSGKPSGKTVFRRGRYGRRWEGTV